MSATAVAAEILETSGQAFARQATERFHAYLANGNLELTENPPAWQGHFRQRIIELAAAVRAGQPALFTDKVLWLRKAYAARGISDAVPQTMLTSLSEALSEAMPSNAATEVAAVIDAAIAALQAAADSPVLSASLDPGRSGDALALRYIAACMDGQTAEATAMILGLIDDGMSPQDAVTNVLLPAEREIGDLWHRNDASISQEHLVTNTTTELLAIIGQRFAAAPGDGPTVLLASVSGNAHDVGIRATGFMFRLAGWRTIYLGTDLPVNEIAGSADYFEVDVVVLSASIATQVEATTQTIRSLRRTATDPAIIVGGTVFEAAPDLWKQLGADALCPRIDEIVATADGLLKR